MNKIDEKTAVFTTKKALFFEAIFTNQAQRGSWFFKFLHFLTDCLLIWLKHGSRHEPYYLRLNNESGSHMVHTNTVNKYKHGSWLIYI